MGTHCVCTVCWSCGTVTQQAKHGHSEQQRTQGVTQAPPRSPRNPHPRAGTCTSRAGSRHPRCHPDRSHKLSLKPRATASTCFTGTFPKKPKLGVCGCCLVDAFQAWGSRLDSVILGTVASDVCPGVSEAACVPGSMGFAPFQAPSALPPARASTSAAQLRD